MGLTKNHLDLRHKESFIERTTKRQSLKDLHCKLLKEENFVININTSMLIVRWMIQAY